MPLVLDVEDLADDADGDLRAVVGQHDGVADLGVGGGQERCRHDDLAGLGEPGAGDHPVAVRGVVAGEGEGVERRR